MSSASSDGLTSPTHETRRRARRLRLSLRTETRGRKGDAVQRELGRITTHARANVRFANPCLRSFDLRGLSRQRDLSFQGIRSLGFRLTDLCGFVALWFIGILLLGPFLAGARLSAEPADHLPGTLRTLTTAREAHSLSAEEAARGYPVHLRAVVVYDDPYDDPTRISLFVHDATGGIYVSDPVGLARVIPAGTMIDVRGVSGTGAFAPVVVEPHITVIGSSHLPVNAPHVSLARLRTGAEDSQWVEVEGVIHSIVETKHNVTLQLATKEGTISAKTLREAGVRYSDLVDARVRLRAVAAVIFNSNLQISGARLVFPDLSVMQVIEAGESDPFHLPTRSIESLSRFNPTATSPHRVHLQGRVTLQWPGRTLCFRDSSRGLCVQTSQTTAVARGELVDVAGFVAMGDNGPVLADAVFKSDGGSKVVAAYMTTAEQSLLGKDDAELIQLDGKLIGRDLGASDTILMLESGKFIFPVILPKDLTGDAIDGWKNGSMLRVTGICSLLVDAESTARGGGAEVPMSFRVLLRSPQDVVVVRRPSWWNPVHTVRLLILVLAVIVVVLGWVVELRRQVEQQMTLVRESEDRFRHMAQHDGLTGLPSRMLLLDRLNVALEKVKRYRAGLGILMLDLDNFKLINDSLGHQAGDEALRITAERLLKAVRKNDTVARMGGDEFVVLLPDLHDPHDAEIIAAKVVAALSIPMRIEGHEVPVSASVGVSTAYGRALDGGALLKSVDTAMYYAKAQGRNCFRLFTANMASQTLRKLRMQASLAHAMERNELELHYQPMVSFVTGELTGIEALLRWRSKEMGLIMPGDFVGLAEESGLIVPIGEWVLREACRQIGILELELGRTLMLAVNLSPRQFQQNNLPKMIERALGDYGRSPRSIEFEITEGMLMSDSSKMALVQMRDLGVQLAIDDFGIGFSSLSYITRFSVDRIKIDRSFTQECTNDGGSLPVIRAIVAMAHGLGIQVVAEGVETEEQFRFLQQEGCDTAQGYYLSRSVPVSELSAMVFPIAGATTPRHAAMELALPAST